MFDSILRYMNRNHNQETEAQALRDEAKQFKLPSEWFPQATKFLFFAGLAILNFRLFASAVPGAWGKGIGVVAMVAEGVAVYCTHYFSRSASWFRLCLGLCGGLLMAFSLVHGTFSVLDLIGVQEITRPIHYYSHVIAFPLLGALTGVSVVALCLTHPKNIVRLKQASAHMRAVIGRAEAASELALMDAQSIVDNARLRNLQEANRRKQAFFEEMKKSIAIEADTRMMVAQIADPQFRAFVWREFGFEGEPPAATQPNVASDPETWLEDQAKKALRH